MYQFITKTVILRKKKDDLWTSLADLQISLDDGDLVLIAMSSFTHAIIVWPSLMSSILNNLRTNISTLTASADCTTSAAPTTQRGDSSSASTSKSKDEGQEDTKPSSSGNKPAETTETAKEPEEDALAETLLCIICQEILHDCIR